MLSALWAYMKTILAVAAILCGAILLTFALPGGAADYWTATAQEVKERVESDPIMLKVLEDFLIDGSDLTEIPLRNLSPAELRLLRHTIYARHGRIFADGDLQRHFDSREWYSVNEAYSDDLLTAEDHRNIAVFLVAEGRGDEARWQESVALSKQAEQMVDVANNIDILSAFLTDKEAVDEGTAPVDFKLQPLDSYKAKGITRPMTAPPEDD